MRSNSSMRTPLSRVRGLGSAKSGTGHFWLQRVTAVANVILTVIFIGIVIALVGRPYPAAVALLSHPLVAISDAALHPLGLRSTCGSACRSSSRTTSTNEGLKIRAADAQHLLRHRDRRSPASTRS